MLQVNEIISLSLFHEFQLIAGEEGLTNELKDIVILEHESITSQYDVFHEGDFVLTSLFFAYDRPELLLTAFKELIKRGISGIAIKTIFFNQLPEEILTIANKHKLPVFFFQHAYMEELILSANELLKSKLHYIVWEEKIATLLHNKPSASEVESVLSSINPGFHPLLFTAYLTGKTLQGSRAIESYFHRLIYKQYHVSTDCTYAYIKYQAGILLVYTVPESCIVTMDSLEKTISYLLRSIDINPEWLYLGINDIPKHHAQFDDSIQQAIYTNEVCRLEGVSYKYYSQLGIYQWITPLLQNSTVHTIYLESIQRLKDYDAHHSSALMDTLMIYIQNNGDITKTATMIFQHSNTVRYRIKKASSVLQLDTAETEEDLYEILYIIMKLYELDQSSQR